MKKLLMILTVILAVLFTACTEDAPEWTVSDYSPSAMETALSDTEVLANSIIYNEANPINDYFDYYFVDTALLEGITDYLFYTSADTSVSEVGIFKVKDKETADALLEALGTRAENLVATYENYSPEDTAIAQNMVKGSFDDIVWFAATADNDAIRSVIEK